MSISLVGSMEYPSSASCSTLQISLRGDDRGASDTCQLSSGVRMLFAKCDIFCAVQLEGVQVDAVMSVTDLFVSSTKIFLTSSLWST